MVRNPLTLSLSILRTMLSPELLNELKLILKEDYALELCDSELEQFARAFVLYGELLAKVLFETSLTKST